MKKVLIPTALDSVARETLEAHGGYAVLQPDGADPAALLAANPDAHALIVRSEKVTAEMIDSAPGLKVVIRAGAGYNTIDIRHARKKGVDVMNTPGANSNAVAEEVVALLLADARHVVAADRSCRDGKWEKKKFMGRELTGKTVGIVGLGHIGQLVAKRLKGFDVKLLGHDPFLSADKARALGITLLPLPELFAQSDAITLHIPENDETRGLVGSALLSAMKPGATLVNCARAGILDEAALRAAKAERGIRFLNDVYPKDAEGPKSVADIADIMLPHLGASTREANRNAALLAARELIDLDDKGIDSAVVNRDIPAGLDPSFGRLANVLTRLCRRLIGPDAKPTLVETSFYGTLRPFAKWLLNPIVAALAQDDPPGTYKQNVAALAERGIDYRDREPDPAKAYANSITIDITAHLDAEHLVRASVRGTVEEGNILVARINDFERLYCSPDGNNVLFIYDDRPGVLAQITSALAAEGVNIDDVRNPHDSAGKTSLAILRVNKPVSDAAVARIGASIGASAAFHVEL